MSYITTQQAAHQKRITGPTFTDTCVRLVEETATGDYGYGSSTYTEEATLPCSFQPRIQNDVQGETEVPLHDADLFVARTATLLADDRITITHLLGEAVDVPQTYQVIAGPMVTHNVLWAKLRLITDGS
jgi:hypothetical protein